jgi:hypothetical protein
LHLHFDLVGVAPQTPLKKGINLSEKMKQIKVFFTVHDFEILKQTSKDQNLTMSEFIRKSVNSKIENAPAPKTKKVYKVADPKLLYELNKIGVNLNQIAKNLNEKKTDVSNVAILKELVNLETKLNELL